MPSGTFRPLAIAFRSGDYVSVKVNPIVAGATRYFSAVHTALYRWVGGVGPFNRNVCILTTKGRKSGREIAKPLLYLKRNDKFCIVASYGGSDQPPSWYRNLKVNPHARIEIGRRSFNCVARTLSKSEKADVWPALLGIWPPYDLYQRHTSRDIPVVELTVVDE